jgi:hypothetical protein
MTDQVSLIHAGIAAVGATVTGVLKTYATPPVNLDIVPALYAFTGGMVTDEEDGDSATETRVYRVQVAAIATGQGNPNTREALCRPIIESAIQEYREHFGLGGVVGVQTSKVVSDSGIVLLPEWGGKYIGFEIRLAVTTIRGVTFVHGG